jgi:enamine deaminase RidA (YjgF/YER057c/UK114 family)
MESRIEPGLAPPPGYAHTVTVGAGERLVFAAGAVPIDQSGSLVGAGDLRAQTRAVLGNLAEALNGAGTGLDRVVATTVYVVAAEQADLATVWEEVRASDLSIGPHSSTLLGVPFLGYTGQLVEITAVAVASVR